ncbi:TPA: hypothetical protein ACH3X2_012645 [Trebouxia sp. C0005]
MTLSHMVSPVVTVAIIFCLGAGKVHSRRLLTSAAPTVPVVDGTCVVSTVPSDTDNFTFPEMQITKGSATFLGRVDSCFSWQVNGTANGEVRTQLLCGGGKPAADQFCRDNDYSKAGSFQVSSMYLQETYAVSDFKICNGESCLGFDSIQCQTCESDVDQESSESAAYTTADVSAESGSQIDATQTEASAPAPSVEAVAYSAPGTASVYQINGSAFCYNDGYGNQGCYNVGNNNVGDHNFGDDNMGSYNNGSYNNGTGNLGNYNQGVNNSGDYNNGLYNNGTGNLGTYNQGINNTGNFNQGNVNAGDYNQGTYNSGDLNAGNQNSGIGNSGNANNGTWNAWNNNAGNNNYGNSNAGNSNVGNNIQGNFVGGAAAPSI